MINTYDTKMLVLQSYIHFKEKFGDCLTFLSCFYSILSRETWLKKYSLRAASGVHSRNRI